MALITAAKEMDLVGLNPSGLVRRRDAWGSIVWETPSERRGAPGASSATLTLPTVRPKRQTPVQAPRTGRHRSMGGGRAKSRQRSKPHRVTVTRAEMAVTFGLGFAFGVLFTGTLLSVLIR